MHVQQFHCQQNQSTSANTLVVQAKVFRVGTATISSLCRAAKARSPSASSSDHGQNPGKRSQTAVTSLSQGELCQCLPLFQRRVDAGWVMQQPWNSTTSPAWASFRLLIMHRSQECDFPHHNKRIHELPTCRVKDALMVRPAWVAHPHTLTLVFFARKSAATRSAPVPPESVPCEHVCH